MPVYNEYLTLQEILSLVYSVDTEKEGIVIDDRSTHSDAWVGHKVFRRDVLQAIRLRANCFGFEPGTTAKIARRGCRAREVPVSYTRRARTDGKKIGWKGALHGIWCTRWYGLIH